MRTRSNRWLWHNLAKYSFWIPGFDSFVWVGNERGDDVDDKQVRNRWRHLPVDRVDKSWERRGVWLLSRKDIIDDRQRGAADDKSSALRIVWEPYIDELLDVVDDIEEREVDDSMINYSRFFKWFCMYCWNKKSEWIGCLYLYKKYA